MIALLGLVTLPDGKRAYLVPVEPCQWCEQTLPVDHDCPVLRALFALAANTIHPDPDALAEIRDRTERNAR